MVDNMNTAPVTEVEVDSGTAPQSGMAGFLGSTTGRIILGAVAVLVILGAAAAIFLTFFSGTGTTGSTPPVTPPPAAPSTAPPSEVESPTVRNPVPLQDTFTFRNIFRPTISPPGTETADAGDGASGDTSGTGSGTVSYPDNTLVLLSIKTVDGEPVGTFYWNGTEYTAGEGDRLGDTPWRVIEISGNSAVMQYGDTRVTLSVGQGLSK